MEKRNSIRHFFFEDSSRISQPGAKGRRHEKKNANFLWPRSLIYLPPILWILGDLQGERIFFVEQIPLWK